MKATNVKLRLTSGEYSYLEMELPEIWSLEMAQELADSLKEKEKAGKLARQSWSTCKHPHLYWKEMEGVTKKGKWHGKKCTACESVQFKNGDGWGEWRPPKSENLL